LSGKRYTEKLNIAAVKQLTKGGRSGGEDARRPGMMTKRLYDRKGKYGQSAIAYQEKKPEQHEQRRLNAELKRLTQR